VQSKSRKWLTVSGWSKQARSKQTYIYTHYNNLKLFLYS